MLRVIFFLAIVIPGGIAALRSRFAGLLLYLWFALFRPQEWLWVDTTSLRLSLVVGGMFVIPCVLTGVLPNVTHWLSFGLLLFFGAGVLSQAYSIQPDLSWAWVDFLGRLILVCLLLVTLTNTRRRFLTAMGVIAVSFAFHAAQAGVMSLISGGLRFSEGLSGAYADSNGYALATVMVIPLLIATAQNTQQPWVRRTVYATVPLCVMTVISTFSRAGFLGLSASALVFIGLQKRRVLGMLILILMSTGWFLAGPIPKGYFSRIETIQTYEEVEDDSAMGRLHFWRVAIDMVRDRPFGVGLRNYDQAYDAYDFLEGRYGHNRSVHSSHLQVLAEMGYAGFGAYCLVMLLSLKTAFRVRAESQQPNVSSEDSRFYVTTANAMITSLTGFLVAGSFIASALNDLTWLVVALIIALDRLREAELGVEPSRRKHAVENPWVAPHPTAFATRS